MIVHLVANDRLTYMASPSELVESKELVKMGGNLLPHEQPLRTMYALPGVKRWILEILPSIESDGHVPGALTPMQQAAVQVHDFIAGKNPEDWMVPKLLRPHKNAVWELRTPDLRLFGWFWRKRVFVLSSIDSALNCKTLSGYTPHINLADQMRERLALDEPKYIEGSLSDVF